jgi:hypothetical protein
MLEGSIYRDDDGGDRDDLDAYEAIPDNYYDGPTPKAIVSYGSDLDIFSACT